MGKGSEGEGKRKVGDRKGEGWPPIEESGSATAWAMPYHYKKLIKIRRGSRNFERDIYNSEFYSPGGSTSIEGGLRSLIASSYIIIIIKSIHTRRHKQKSDYMRCSLNRKNKGKGKGQVLDIALLHDEHNVQERFKISEVAADWHELMIPQRIMQPSIARATEQLDPRCST